MHIRLKRFSDKFQTISFPSLLASFVRKQNLLFKNTKDTQFHSVPINIQQIDNSKEITTNIYLCIGAIPCLGGGVDINKNRFEHASTQKTSHFIKELHRLCAFGRQAIEQFILRMFIVEKESLFASARLCCYCEKAGPEYEGGNFNRSCWAR